MLAAFRHSGNRKWFAIIMSVTEDRLGLKGDKILDIVNFKCEQALIGSLLGEEGFYPARPCVAAFICRSINCQCSQKTWTCKHDNNTENISAYYSGVRE